MAQIDVRDIDEQIAKLQELRKVVSDPTMLGLLNQLLTSKNGHSSTVLPTITQREDKAKPKRRGNLLHKIEETCRAFGHGTFTITDVIKAFEERGNAFVAKDKNVATYTALRRLEERKIIAVVERGVGSRASTYRVVQ